MPTMHSILGELHPGKSRILRDARQAKAAKSPLTKLTVSFPDHSLRMELCRGDQTIFAGCWDAKISLDGEAVEPISEYEETCWVSDKDVNYLELELHLSGGLRLERHVVYAREEQFVFLADAVFGPRVGKIEYRGSLPLAEGVKFQSDRQHTEGAIVGKKKIATVLPLALPEWKTPENADHLQAENGCLQLSQSLAGQNLFAPLLFDLKTRRLDKPLTWRQLTVAESLEKIPVDLVAGFRAMIGREQWLIYRSLAPKANRTLLGHNLSSEFLLARFRKNGEVQSLIEVE
jgi:hypothetical protein